MTSCHTATHIISRTHIGDDIGLLFTSRGDSYMIAFYTLARNGDYAATAESEMAALALPFS